MSHYKDKVTPGPVFSYWRRSDGEADCGVTGENGYAICRAPRYQTKERWNADGALIAEAFNVLHKTGLTPWELAEQRDRLLAALKSCAAVCAGESLSKRALVNALESARDALAACEAAS